MFSNLENFLSAKDELKLAEADASKTSSFEVANDSWLDSSDSCNFEVKTKTKGAGNGKDVNDDDDDVDIVSSKKYVPVKGQKMAAKRLKKIQDTLQKGLVDTAKIQDRIDKQKSKAKKTSPSKRSQQAAQRGGRRSQRNYVELDDLDSDSDCDEPLANNAHRQHHDPNTIVLDCDDVFNGGPAVNFTRDIAGASAVSVEQSQEMKVSVRINSKVEQFLMNPFQKLSALISRISLKKGLPANQIALMLKEKILSETETLNSVGYIQGLILNAHISSNTETKKRTSKNANQCNADKLEIKIQAEGRKRPFITHISPTDQLIALAFACAEEFKCELDKVAIEFDGEFVDFKQTAEDLALEGGEVMDFFQKK